MIFLSKLIFTYVNNLKNSTIFKSIPQCHDRKKTRHTE